MKQNPTTLPSKNDEVSQLLTVLGKVAHEVDQSELSRAEQDMLLMDINLATQFLDLAETEEE